MSDLVTLITPTGGRQECFELCQKYIERQTYKGDFQWLVVDDCNPPTKAKKYCEYYRGPKDWKPGINTQRLNLDFVLPKIKGDYILFIEDDDWYHPKYIETMVDLLKSVPVVGETNAKYYNVQMPGYKEMQNYLHASLCQTGLSRELLPLLEWAINSGEIYIDVVLWKLVKEKKVASALLSELNLTVGMKKLPGRDGIGMGHKQKDYNYDQGHIKLKHWIGEDVSHYQKYTQNNFNKDF